MHNKFMNRSRIFALLASFLWSLVVLSVAIPNEFLNGLLVLLCLKETNGSVPGIAAKLISEPHYLFAVFVLMIDIIIAVTFLGDKYLKATLESRIVKLLILAVVALLFSIAVFVELDGDFRGKYAFEISWICAGFLIIGRYMTYHHDLMASPTTTPTLTEAGT